MPAEQQIPVRKVCAVESGEQRRAHLTEDGLSPCGTLRTVIPPFHRRTDPDTDFCTGCGKGDELLDEWLGLKIPVRMEAQAGPVCIPEAEGEQDSFL